MPKIESMKHCLQKKLGEIQNGIFGYMKADNTAFCKLHTKYFLDRPMDKTPSHTQQASSSAVDNDGDIQLSPSTEKMSGSEDEIEPPAGLTFMNLQPLKDGYEGLGYESPVRQHILKQKICVRRNKPSRFRWSTFHTSFRLLSACTTNNVEAVAQMLSDGVRIDCSDSKGRCPLHVAARKGYSEIVRLLLQIGANPNCRNSYGKTPLHTAVSSYNVEIVAMLLDAGTDISITDDSGCNPLQLAQSELRFLQMFSNKQADLIKEEVKKLIEIMLAYLHKCGQETEAELLGEFLSRLTLSSTQEDVKTGVRDLLVSLDSLNLDKPSNSKTK